MKKYNIIKQVPYCCVPVCLQIIMERNKITYDTQEEIGYELGLVVPKEYKQFFKKVRTGKKPSAGYGTRVNEDKYSINSYFKSKNIRLKEEYYYIDNLLDAEKLIMDNISNNDIIVCFHNDTLFNDGFDYGHVALIENYEDEIVTLLEVDRNLEDYRFVKLEDLLNAIIIHGKLNRAGFWIISEK